MKKKNLWKRFLAAGLAALMGVSLAACGGSGSGEGEAPAGDLPGDAAPLRPWGGGENL